ncbi:MAG: hypothetical protein IJT34_00910 [Butyrivibrio sp.]|nr:hypothetical protein [Butyrivibrio sp.]
MNQKSNERTVVLFTTLGSIGLIMEIILMGWQFWVPIFILVGMIAVWAIHLSDRIDYDTRTRFYFGYSALLLFYHGVQNINLFDIMGPTLVVMLTYSLFNTV